MTLAELVASYDAADAIQQKAKDALLKARERQSRVADEEAAKVKAAMDTYNTAKMETDSLKQAILNHLNRG